MDQSFTITLQQVDTINLSLEKAMAIAQMVAECGNVRHQTPDHLPSASLFAVMQVVIDELEKIGAVMKVLEGEESTGDDHAQC